MIVSEKLKGESDSLKETLIGDGKFTEPDKADSNSKGKSFMDGINLLIFKELGPEYQLGGAYFVSDEFREDPKKYIENLWSHHIEVILKDYLRGNKKKDNLMGKFRDVYEEYKKRVADKL